MPLTSGSRFGPYEIQSPLGAGGMGEVYRARDTRLQRDIAIKILPDLFALDAERLARFKREAQVLASLNHPNIAGIYGLEEAGGVIALALELVEGPTLADRIAQGPIAFDEARSIARQIADALETAHEQGIVHRDLKPANIKVRPDGTVKVLDFGLAKALDTSPGASGLSMSPTITTPAATRMGVILGTAAYMAPEQARGRAVDKRADIWAFGIVLFEMLTGQRAFEGDDVTDILGAVIHKEPEWKALPASLPLRVVDLIRRCLKKDPKERVRDIGDVRLALDEADAPAPVVSAVPRRSRWAEHTVLGAVVVALIATLPFTVAHLRESPPRLFQVRFTLPPPDGTVFTGGTQYAPGQSVSADGRFIVFQAQRENVGAPMLWLRDLASPAPRPIAGTEGGIFAFWSPDSRFIGFFANAKLKKIDVAGGPPLVLADATAGEGGTWNRDGTILFAPSASSALARVSSAGGQPIPATRLDASRKESSHRWPQFLPDGRHFIFTAYPGNAVMVGSLDSSDVRLLFNAESRTLFSPPGYLLFARQGTLMARPFDAGRLAVTGEAVPVVEQFRYSGATSRASMSVSENGVLAYRTDESVTGTPVWVDRNGHETASIVRTPLETAENPRLSPDGRRLALIVGGEVWVYDLEGRPPIKITTGGPHYAPLWTPDGKRLVYETNLPTPLQSMAADGSGGTPDAIAPAIHLHPHGWSPDGRDLIVVQLDSAATVPDIMKLTPGAKSELQPVVQTPAVEGAAGTTMSPDGRWLAYVSDSTGQPEIWVRPYGAPGPPVRVSANGGVEPIWARNGRELFYFEGTKLMAVPIDARTDVSFTPAVLLFDSPYLRGGQPPSYDVALDGRFVMLKPANPHATVTPVTVVLNWTEKLASAGR